MAFKVSFTRLFHKSSTYTHPIFLWHFHCQKKKTKHYFKFKTQVPSQDFCTLTSGNRGKSDITLYDSRYWCNDYAAIQPITMGVSNTWNSDAWKCNLSQLITVFSLICWCLVLEIVVCHSVWQVFRQKRQVALSPSTRTLLLSLPWITRKKKEIPSVCILTENFGPGVRSSSWGSWSWSSGGDSSWHRWQEIDSKSCRLDIIQLFLQHRANPNMLSPQEPTPSFSFSGAPTKQVQNN